MEQPGTTRRGAVTTARPAGSARPSLPARVGRRLRRYVRRLLAGDIPSWVTVKVTATEVRLLPGRWAPLEVPEDVPASHSSLAPERVQTVYVWRTEQDPKATAMAQALQRSLFGRAKATLAFIDEQNNDRTGASTMLDLVSRLHPNDQLSELMGTSSMVLVADPTSNLPLAVSRTWPGARLVLVLTSPLAFEWSGLIAPDAILAASGVELDERIARAVPYLGEFADTAELDAHVKALWNVSQPGRHSYLSVIKGSPDAISPASLDAAARETQVVIALPSGWQDPAGELTDFGSYLDAIWADASAVAIGSGLIYLYENLLTSPDAATLRQFVARGARVAFVADDRESG